MRLSLSLIASSTTRGATGRAIVVENVDMPDAVCGITACLASLGAYSLFRQSLCPSLMAGAEMVRRRMFWIALRAT